MWSIAVLPPVCTACRPSYNIPYFTDVYNETGYPDARAALASRGDLYRGVSNSLSYQVGPVHTFSQFFFRVLLKHALFALVPR